MNQYSVGDKVQIVQNDRYIGDRSQQHIGKVGVVRHRTVVNGEHTAYAVEIATRPLPFGPVICHSTELQPAGALEVAAAELREANRALLAAKALEVSP